MKLQDLIEPTHRQLRAEKSESVDFQSEKKKFQLDGPALKKNRIEEQNLTLENIRKKMDEPEFQSNVISRDVGKQILRFENTNCFDKEP